MRSLLSFLLLSFVLLSDAFWITTEAQTPSSSTYPSYRRSTHRAIRSPGRIRHYTNSRGRRVQSPTYYSAPPAGATAECRDGTYSFSHSRRGTCSRHGGVKRWLFIHSHLPKLR